MKLKDFKSLTFGEECGCDVCSCSDASECNCEVCSGQQAEEEACCEEC